MSKTETRPKDAPEAEDPATEDPAADSEEPVAAEQDAEPEAEEPKAEKSKKTVDPKQTENLKKTAGNWKKAVRGRRSWRGVPAKAWLVRATVVVALAGSSVTAGLQWHAADQAAQRDAERDRIRASAAEFGQALLSYDHTKLQAARHHVLALASDDFAKTYDEAFTGGLEGVITKLKADATATVQGVYLQKVEEGTAKAVVVMDSEVHSTAGTRRVRGSYLDMRLVRRGGEWKVTDVTSIGAANESMTDPQGKQQNLGQEAPAPEKSP
ncbi:hypothetical protein [Actinomadura sp. GTD37]|uniref:hypothetical protein n=1 Tax=Actinomadura sp. GTD37 TaxID=1778030 RepID=UPI0035BFCDF3